MGARGSSVFGGLMERRICLVSKCMALVRDYRGGGGSKLRGKLRAFHGRVEEAVVAVEGGGVAGGALVIEFGDEGGVVVAPAVNGLALDADLVGDCGVGVAEEDEGNRGALPVGE